MPPQRVAVFRALQLGDLLCSVPALRAVRAALPTAEISLIGLPWAREFANRFGHFLDGFHEFPGWPGLPEQSPRLAEAPAFLSAMQQQGFDLVIQMHGNGGLTNPLVALFGARRLAGYFVPGQFCPDPAQFLPYPQEVHEVRRHLRLMEFLGMPSRGDELEFPVREQDCAALRSLLDALSTGEYVCLHPGARAAERRWPPHHFAAVGDALAAEGFVVVFTGSPAEVGLTRAVAAAMTAPALDLAGRTDLGTLAALLQGARLLVCNDTGVSHLGTAVGVPSVLIYHEDRQRRLWAPLDGRCHRALCGGPAVSPRQVLAEARVLLHATPSARTALAAGRLLS